MLRLTQLGKGRTGIKPRPADFIGHNTFLPTKRGESSSIALCPRHKRPWRSRFGKTKSSFNLQILNTSCQLVCPWHFRALVVTYPRSAFLSKSHPGDLPLDPKQEWTGGGGGRERGGTDVPALLGTSENQQCFLGGEGPKGRDLCGVSTSFLSSFSDP